MSELLKNWLYQNNRFSIRVSNNNILIAACVSTFILKAQTANYVQNGSFEKHQDCTNIRVENALGWSEMSANKVSRYALPCIGNMPNDGLSHQFPKTGNALVLSTWHCIQCVYYSKRVYLKNILRSTLGLNEVYCVKFHVNVSNPSPVGMDGFAAYFGDNSLDTIQLGGKVLNYLTPQISNPNNNIITDTLNWIAITGTFTANGTEKYIVLGNFKTDANTNTLAIQSGTLGVIGTDVLVDDVSCIPIDLPAFAGKDTSCIPGTAVYIGRTRDVGIDEACTWYKLPDMSTPIANGVAGLTVSPVQTSTYVVKQQLWCSGIKYDTVVVYKDGVGLEKLKLLNEGLKIYPIPATESCILSVENDNLIQGFNRLTVFNSLGQIVLKKEVVFEQGITELETGILPGGSFAVELSNSTNERIVKKLIISK